MQKIIFKDNLCLTCQFLSLKEISLWQSQKQQIFTTLSKIFPNLEYSPSTLRHMRLLTQGAKSQSVENTAISIYMQQVLSRSALTHCINTTGHMLQFVVIVSLVRRKLSSILSVIRCQIFYSCISQKFEKHFIKYELLSD